MRDYVDGKKLLNVVNEDGESDEGDEDDEDDESEFSFGPNSFRSACTARHFLYEFLMVISARGATAVAANGAHPSSRSWHIRFSGCARHFFFHEFQMADLPPARKGDPKFGISKLSFAPDALPRDGRNR